MSNPKDNVKNFLIRKYFLLCTQEKVSDLITQECIHKNSFDAIEKFLPWRIKLLDLCKIMGITRAQLKKLLIVIQLFLIHKRILPSVVQECITIQSK